MEAPRVDVSVNGSSVTVLGINLPASVNQSALQKGKSFYKCIKEAYSNEKPLAAMHDLCEEKKDETTFNDIYGTGSGVGYDQ